MGFFFKKKKNTKVNEDSNNNGQSINQNEYQLTNTVPTQESNQSNVNENNYINPNNNISDNNLLQQFNHQGGEIYKHQMSPSLEVIPSESNRNSVNYSTVDSGASPVSQRLEDSISDWEIRKSNNTLDVYANEAATAESPSNTNFETTQDILDALDIDSNSEDVASETNLNEFQLSNNSRYSSPTRKSRPSPLISENEQKKKSKQNSRSGTPNRRTSTPSKLMKQSWIITKDGTEIVVSNSPKSKKESSRSSTPKSFKKKSTQHKSTTPLKSTSKSLKKSSTPRSQTPKINNNIKKSPKIKSPKSNEHFKENPIKTTYSPSNSKASPKTRDSTTSTINTTNTFPVPNTTPSTPSKQNKSKTYQEISRNQKLNTSSDIHNSSSKHSNLKKINNSQNSPNSSSHSSIESPQFIPRVESPILRSPSKKEKLNYKSPSRKENSKKQSSSIKTKKNHSPSIQISPSSTYKDIMKNTYAIKTIPGSPPTELKVTTYISSDISPRKFERINNFSEENFSTTKQQSLDLDSNNNKTQKDEVFPSDQLIYIQILYKQYPYPFIFDMTLEKLSELIKKYHLKQAVLWEIHGATLNPGKLSLSYLGVKPGDVLKIIHWIDLK